jgi:hypothetical protein
VSKKNLAWLRDGLIVVGEQCPVGATALICPTTGRHITAGDQRNTPLPIVELIKRFAPIGVDPCGNAGSQLGAFREYRLERGEDGLVLPWCMRGQPKGSIVPVNGPWSALLKWVEKAREEHLRYGVESVFICRPEAATEWSKLLLATASRVTELSERYEFPCEGMAAGTDVVSTRLAYIGERTQRWTDVCRDAGHEVFARAA